jgi:type I site-specific restriction-modification system R (restriction) subunit
LEGGGVVRKFMDRGAGRGEADEVAGPAGEDAVERFPDARPVTAVTESAGSAGGDADADVEIARVGEHVSSVVQAANQAAKRIEEDARSHAERLRERTEKQAASTLDAARREAEKLLVEAERLRTEAESESKEIRERAETYAAEKLRDAEAEAAGVVARAERLARASASAAEERSRWLESNVELAEKRLKQLATGLFDTASRLEGLSERPGAHPPGEEAASEPPGEEASEPAGEGLLDEALVASVTGNEPE